MNFEVALVAWLKAHNELNTAVGGRVYPDRLPSPVEYPAVVYTRVSSPEFSVHDGPLNLVEARFQFDIWGTTAASRGVAGKAFRDALLGYVGKMGVFDVAIPSMPYTTSGFETESGLYRQVLEFIIWHGEE